MVKSILSPLGVIGSLLLDTAGGAHHSSAMFDMTQTKAIEGTLYAVEWKNPHSWIWVTANSSGGQVQTYGFEAGSPIILTRQGYTKETLKVGAKARVTYRPLRDGQPGGMLVEIRFETPSS